MVLKRVKAQSKRYKFVENDDSLFSLNVIALPLLLSLAAANRLDGTERKNYRRTADLNGKESTNNNVANADF